MSIKAFVAFMIVLSMAVSLIACANNSGDKIPDLTTDAVTESKVSQTTDLDTSSNNTSEKATESKDETTEIKASTDEVSETVTESDPVEVESTEAVTENSADETESKEINSESSDETDKARPTEPPTYPVPEESSEEDTISPTESISSETQIVTEETTEDVVETTEKITEETTEEEVTTTEKEITEETSSSNVVLPSEDELLLYEEYEALSGAEQQRYFETVFHGDFDAFFEWLDSALADYEERNPSIEVGGDETIDLGGN